MSGYRYAQGVVPRSNKGFTLLELLVALSIGVVLIVASGSIIRSSVDLMARGERWLQGDFREASVLEFWREQVSAVRTSDSTNTLFMGRKGELNFVTPVVLNTRDKGLVEVHYTIKEEEKKHSLVYKEKRLTPGGITQEKEEKGPDGIVLLKGYDRISFEYLGETKTDNKDNNPWKAEWMGGGGIPRALKLTLIRGNGQRTLIAPIVATSFSSSFGQ